MASLQASPTPRPLSRRSTLLIALGSALAPTISLAGSVSGRAWPFKPLRLVVGFPGGSSPDLVARTLADPLSKALGQPVIVENRVGASGNIAAEYVARASDEHTLGLMINGNMTIARLLNPKLGYNPLKDLSPVSLVATSPLVLTAQAHSPGVSLDTFLSDARKAGNQWSYGSPGIGTVSHIGMEWLKNLTHLDPVHIPYPGNPQVISAMLGGEIQLALLPPGLVAPQVKAGKLRAVGVTSAVRSALLPEVPSLAEAGIKNFNLEVWDAVAAPSSMPPALVLRLSGLISEIARQPEVRSKLFQQGWQVAGSSAEGLANRVQTDYQAMAEVIRQRGISAE